MDINNWLGKFKEYWERKNLDGVLSLFSDDVEYFETPYLKLESKEAILSEWQGVLLQDDIFFNYSIFAEAEEKNAVLWELAYKKDGIEHGCKGTYLIKLNPEGLCTYFYQICEEGKE